MKQLKTIILLMMVALLPMPALANEGGEGDDGSFEAQTVKFAAIALYLGFV